MQPCSAADTAASEPDAARVPERADIEQRHKWDLTDLFPDADAWERAFAASETATAKLAAMKGTLHESADTLLAVLQHRDKLFVDFERVHAYAMMLKDQDTRESQAQALYDRAGTLAVKLSEAASWIEPELLALDEATLRDWCDANDDLAPYRHHFDNVLRLRPHVLTAREEELLAMGGKVAAASQQAFTMLTNADMKFPTIRDEDGNQVELSEGRFTLYLQSQDRTVRRDAFMGLLGTYLSLRNAIAAMLAGSVQKDIYSARTHNHNSALEAALSPDRVPVEVYDNLIATIREHLPKLHRYQEIRRKRLSLEKVHAYDSMVPLISDEPPKISYDDAVAKISEGMTPLGDEYGEPMNKGFAARWIDVHETQGKRSGAYSMGTYAVHPYILLNFNGTYREMFTIAHEMGHSMHTWFTQHHQPPVYGDYPIFLAEVASTTNEILLGDYLRTRAKDDAERLFLVNLAVEGIRGTVITQTMWAEFEKVVHAEAEKGGPMTFETISSMYREIVLQYFGPAYQHDEEVDGYWLRIPHFYRGFYVYKYATSYCAATALAGRILHGEPEALKGYLGFLKSGCSEYPIETLRKAGVDMSTPQPIHDTMNHFGRLLDDLEDLLARASPIRGTSKRRDAANYG